MYRIFACTGLRHRSKKIKSGVTGIHFSSIVETKVGYSVCYIKGQNAITNKRLYLLSWWADIMTSRRRGLCSYIELRSTRHFDLPRAIFRLAPHYYATLFDLLMCIRTSGGYHNYTN